MSYGIIYLISEWIIRAGVVVLISESTAAAECCEADCSWLACILRQHVLIHVLQGIESRWHIPEVVVSALIRLTVR